MSGSIQNEKQLLSKLKKLPPERLAEVEDFVDFLNERLETKAKSNTRREPLDFPVDHLGSWPRDLSLHREDMYGNDGR